MCEYSINIWQLKTLKQNILCSNTGKVSKQNKNKERFYYYLILKAKRKTKNNDVLGLFLETWNKDKLKGRDID